MCTVHVALLVLQTLPTHRARNNTRRSASARVCTLDRRHLSISREDGNMFGDLSAHEKGFFERKDDAPVPVESVFTSYTPVLFKYHASAHLN